MWISFKWHGIRIHISHVCYIAMAIAYCIYWSCFSLVYSSPFSVSSYSIAYIALCKLNDTKLLNCCTHTVLCARYMGHRAWSNWASIQIDEIIYLFTDLHPSKIISGIRRIYWSWNSKLIIFRGQKCVIGHFFTISENSSLVLTILAYKK